MELVSTSDQEKGGKENIQTSMTTETCLADVHPDILSLILSKLFFKDHCNFKLVCKSWNLICPIWLQLPPSIDSSEFHSPCLLIPQTSNCFWKIFHSLYNTTYYLKFPELTDAEILYSKYGWLLLFKDEAMIFFFNPFTREKIELPFITKSFYSVCFTSPPTSSNCIIFGLSIDTRHYFDFSFIKVGEKEWKSKVLPAAPIGISNCPPVFLDGVFYYLECRYRTLMTFDLAKEKMETIYVESDECSEESISIKEEEDEDEEDEDEEEEEDEEDQEKGEDEDEEEIQRPPIIHESYMIDVDGDIWCVFVTSNEKRVGIYKLDLSEYRWIKLESLGDKCLYASTNGSFAETSNINEMMNKIYFNKFHDKSGVMYSLTNGRYYSVGGGFASEDAYGLIDMDCGVWVKPTPDHK